MALSPDQNESLKFVDRQNEYLVHGFTQSLKKTVPLSTGIPAKIIQLCLLYFVDPDEFVQSEHFESACDDIIISGPQNDTITKQNKNNLENTTIASNWIPSNNKSNVYQWTIKVLNNRSAHNGIAIGVISKIPSSLNGQVFFSFRSTFRLW